MTKWVEIGLILILVLGLFFPSMIGPQNTANRVPGQSMTLLPDGQWLLLGGESASGRPLSTAEIWNPRTGTITPLPDALQIARAHHSATMLPDGAVLIFGGIGPDGQVLSSPELFDPSTSSFSLVGPLSSVLGPALSPRSHHTATLLTDGQVLIAGGIGAEGEPLDFAELLDFSSAIRIPQSTARFGHSATLLPDGTVLLSGGTDRNGDKLDSADLFDPVSERFILQSGPGSLPFALSPLRLEASLPEDGAVDVAVDSFVALRFSTPLNVVTVNSETVTLLGPNGVEQIKVVPAEGGMLVFLTPELPLLPDATYTVSVNGAVDVSGLLLPLSGFTFTTAPADSAIGTPQSAMASQPSGSSQPTAHAEPETRTPQSEIRTSQSDDLEWKGSWKDGKPHSPWQDLPPLQADPGVTALAGQILDLQGDPLADVNLRIEGTYGSEVEATTDETGRFLLKYLTSGRNELIIDGRRAIPQSEIRNPQSNYGVFEYGLEIKEGETNVLPFTSWLPKIDTANAVKISSPTNSKAIVTTPRIPGLEVHVPENTVIYDHEWKVVKEVSITPIPLDRTPFPLPRNVEVPIYFTVQPGGGYIKNLSGGLGARIIYPNYRNELPGTRFRFWHYDPDYKDWYVYGLGTVMEDGKQVVPDPPISIYEFTGAMVANPDMGPEEGGDECTDEGGDPVNLCTGLFEYSHEDFNLPDVVPIVLSRTYRTRDTFSRGFGIGTSHPYDMFIVGDTFPYTFAEIILEDGSRIHYDRISPGTSFAEAVYEHTSSPTRFYKSKITWNGAGYDLKFKDGTIYGFEEGFEATRPGQAGLIRIEDRFGNILNISRDSNGNVTKITSPNGRWIEFTSDAGNRVTQAKDNIGRTVSYEYDATGRLIRVTNPIGGITEYTYDTFSRMLTVKDPRGNVVVTSEYDATGNVIKQTLANSGTFTFAYTFDVNGKIIQTDVTDPRGNVERLTFNSAGYTLSHTRAVGKPEEQTTTYERQAGSSHVLSAPDALGRKTAYTYDSLGNVMSITQLANTPQAMTTSYTYEPTFNNVATITNLLGRTTSFAYDAKGNLISVTNPLGNTTTFTYNSAGQLTSTTDPLGNTTQFTYDMGDLVAITDSVGNTRTNFVDAAGRLLSVNTPLTNLTTYDYDTLNRLTQVNDPLNGVTSFGYDPNGNLLSVTDPRNNSAAYTYDSMNRLETRRDPLLRTETYQYDLAGNVIQFVDRKGQATTYEYDALNRRTRAIYADLSTTSYTYDAANRLTQVNDSISGLITRAYDIRNRLTREVTPQGQVDYTYDTVGRRTSMTVFGQPTVNYAYDNMNRLTQIAQGSSVVTFTYDAMSRRSRSTLPNGIVMEYTYDGASRMIEIKYKTGTTVLGDLTYEYDKAGSRTKIGGTFARTGIPQAITASSYNAANHQLALGDKTMTFDNNGNVTTVTDATGTTTYSWNARNQLAAISGPGVSASFVYDGLGRRQKKIIGSNPTEFLYDGISPVQEVSGGTIAANILTGLGIDERFTRTDSNGTVNMLTDALGSVIALADPAGTVQTEYSYDAFGKATVTGASNSNPYQYAGRENDGTGLYYYRARYYHPTLQRFISEDPIEYNGNDINLYAYVANNPVTLFDPSGLTIATNWKFFWEWVFEGGDSEREYGQGTVELEEIRNSPGAAKMRAEFQAGDCRNIRDGSFGTLEAYFKTAWRISSTSAQVGGFLYDATNNGNETVTYEIRNRAGAYSFFLHFPAIPKKLPRGGTLHLFGDINQTFRWTEKSPCCQ